MRLFGKKKKKPQVQEHSYEIFGGFTITKTDRGYEITWRSPNLTTITVDSEPVIEENVQTKREGNQIQVLSPECRLKIITKEETTEAHIAII